MLNCQLQFLLLEDHTFWIILLNHQSLKLLHLFKFLLLKHWRLKILHIFMFLHLMHRKFQFLPVEMHVIWIFPMKHHLNDRVKLVLKTFPMELVDLVPHPRWRNSGRLILFTIAIRHSEVIPPRTLSSNIYAKWNKEISELSNNFCLSETRGCVSTFFGLYLRESLIHLFYGASWFLIVHAIQ